MKLKKLFAGILAVAMMATMAAPAFAANRSNKYVVEPTGGNTKITVDENGEFKINKAYTANNDGATAPDETFNLTIEKYDVKNSSIKEDDFKADDKYNLTITGAKWENGEITAFSGKVPDYGKPGEFIYKLHEVNNGTTGVTYDDNDYYLTVYAFQKGDSTDKVEKNDLQYAVRLSRGLAALTDKTNKDYKVDTINNSYAAEPLTITKIVNGNMGDRTQDFTFRVEFKSPIDKTVKSTISVAGDHGTVKQDGKDLERDENNNFSFTFETTATLEFTLKHGQTITFTNLPAGVAYTVEEINVPDGYDTYITSSDAEGEAEATKTDGSIAEKAVTINYENVNGDTVIDTGVILDNAPYIALMMIVVAGAAVMVIKKRRHYED